MSKLVLRLIIMAQLACASFAASALDLVPESSLFVSHTLAEEVMVRAEVQLLDGAMIMRRRSVLKMMLGDQVVSFSASPEEMTVTGLRLSVEFETPQGRIYHSPRYDFKLPVIVSANDPVTVNLRITEPVSGLRRIEVLNSATLAQIIPISRDYWRATYWNNKVLSGEPVLVTKIATSLTVAGDSWGISSPAPGVNTDNWSARFEKRFVFEGNIEFTVGVDDGARLFLDAETVPLIESWKDQGYTQYSSRRVLTGEHIIRIEFYDAASVARLTFRAVVVP